MEGSNVFGGCHDMIALLENSNNSLWVPPPSSFHENMVNFDQESQQGRMGNPKRDRYEGGAFARASEGGEVDTGGEESDANPYHQSEKKRRLTREQVEFLEKSFVVENKLEPERKVELAKQLGLQPRQVAIWFQNRRARYKTKQIEKEYDVLRASYDRLKVDFDSLNKEKENLQKEVAKLKRKLGQKGNETDLNPDNVPQLDEEMAILESYAGKVQKTGPEEVVMPSTRQAEDASSAKSDVFDSESPHCTDNGNHSSVQIEASSTLLVRDRDQQSDFSQEDEEHLMISKSLLLPQTPPTFNNFLKVPDDDGNYDPNANSCNFSLVDDQPFWSWLY